MTACRLAHPPSKRCAKSYDVLRLDISVPACGLLSSHDDFSVVDNLPEDAAVITQARFKPAPLHYFAHHMQPSPALLMLRLQRQRNRRCVWRAAHNLPASTPCFSC